MVGTLATRDISPCGGSNARAVVLVAFGGIAIEG